MLKQRLITAFTILPLFLVVMWYGNPWFTAFVALAGLIGLAEFYRHSGTAKTPLLNIFGLIWAFLFLVSPHLSAWGVTRVLLLTVGLTVSLVLLLCLRPRERVFSAWVWMLGGALYIGWMLSYFIALYGLEGGREWVFFAVFACSGSDIFAYFIGRAWGKHIMAPTISPGKTWEGALGGLLGALALGMIIYFSVFSSGMSVDWWHAVILCLLISVFGQAGDLVESLFKRNMSAKESGNSLPGHGGFMDRLDSVVFTGVVVYYYVVWLL